MKNYYEMRKLILNFLKENKMLAADLMRVGKDLCVCGTCKYYVDHYTKDGTALDFGHCRKNNIPKSKRPNLQSCGFWDFEVEKGGAE